MTGVAGADEQFLKKLPELEYRYAKNLESVQKSFADRAKRTSQLTLPLDSYVGKYHNEWFGDFTVGIENNALAIGLGNLHAVSTPFTQKESIRVELIPGSGKVVFFKPDDLNKVNSLTYEGNEYKRIK